LYITKYVTVMLIPSCRSVAPFRERFQDVDQWPWQNH